MVGSSLNRRGGVSPRPLFFFRLRATAAAAAAVRNTAAVPGFLTTAAAAATAETGWSDNLVRARVRM